MGKSLDQLIDFLLDEVALSGESGLAFSEIVGAVRQFYTSDDQSAGPDRINNPEPVSSSRKIVPLVDFPFLDRIWKWLGRHEDVSIGRNHLYNHTSLVELERIFPGLLAAIPQSGSSNIPAESASSFLRASAPRDFEDGGDITVVDTDIGKRQHGPSVYVTKIRMSIAICGHPPDSTRCFPSEWQLLSHIAAARQNGLLQGDLTRLSGQDKRSVPKRTDSLQRKGYVVKQTAYVRGNKTSRLILQRYVADQVNSASGNHEPTAPSEVHTVRHHCHRCFKEFDKLGQLVPEDDLALALGWRSSDQRLILDHIIRHFIHTGCLKRTNTVFGPLAQSSGLKLCVQWIRNPEETDWLRSDDDDIDFEKLLPASFQQQHQLTVESNHDTGDYATNGYNISGGVSKLSARQIPQWNPDRILVNTLLHAAAEFGQAGLTNIEARKHVTGIFVRRVLESLLMKSSHYSLQSQPAGLKHLSIVRSRQVVNGIVVFLHYAIRRFAELVAIDQRTWGDADGGDQFLKELPGSTLADLFDMNAHVSRDDLGFPINVEPALQVSGGKLSFTDIAERFRAKNIPLTTGEPVLGRDSAGHLTLTTYHSQPARRNKSKSSAKGSRLKRTSSNTKLGDPGRLVRIGVEEVAMGRPRKFMRGTEKFWRDMFLLAKRAEDPAYTKSNSAGLMNEIAGLRVFNARPFDFDETLVEAVSARLPIPRTPSEITRHWIDTTLTILDPPQDGLFFSLIGHVDNRRTVESKIMVVKLPGIRAIDFSNRNITWDWQSLLSSASHSHRYQRYYPNFGNSSRAFGEAQHHAHVEHDRETQSKLRKKRVRLITAASTKNDNISQAGPPRGLFFEEITALAEMADDDDLRVAASHMPQEARLLEESDATASDPDLPRRSMRRDVTISERVSISPSKPLNQSDQASPDSQEAEVDFFEDMSNVWPEAPAPTRTRPLRIIQPTKKVTEMLQVEGETQSDSPQRLVRNKNLSEQGHELNVTSTSHSSDEPQPSTDLAEVRPVTNVLVNGAVQTTVQTQSDSQLLTTSHGQFLQAAVALPKSAQALVQDDLLTITHSAQPVARIPRLPLELQQDQRQHVGFLDSSLPESHQSFSRTESLVAEPENASSMKSPEPVPVESSFQPESLDVQTDTPQISRLPAQKHTSSLKRTRAEVDDQTEDSEHARHVQRRKQGDATRPQITKLCRQILLELLELCSGVAPCEPYTFRRAMGPSWQESGLRSEPPTARIVRTSLNNLCQGAKYQRLTFAYQTRAGAMDKKQIIASRKLNLGSAEVAKLQAKMIAAEPTDYVPPELEAEARRIATDIRPSELILDEDVGESASGNIKQPMRSRSMNPKRQSRRNNSAMLPPESSPSGSPEPTSLNMGFLTLKIARLHTLNLPTSYALTYSPSEANPIDRSKSSLRQEHVRRASHRSASETRTTPKRRYVTWKKFRNNVLPDSIDEIPNIAISRNKAAISQSTNPFYTLFEAEVDCVATWEVKSSDIFEPSGKHLRFINHHPNPYIVNEGPALPAVEFRALVKFDLDGCEAEMESPEARSWAPFRIALRKARAVSPSVDGTPKPGVKRKYTRRTRTEDSDVETTRKKRKSRRKVRSVHEKGTHYEKDGDRSAQILRKRAQLVRHVSHEVRYRVIVAVVVIRTLVGGIEKYINWSLVNRLFPDRDEEILQNLWKSLFFKHRTDVNGLTDSLQEKYLEALVEGRVPNVNFDALDDTDWEGILQWALANLDKFTINKVDDLPDTRKKFAQFNTCTLNETIGVADILTFGSIATQPRKEEVYGSIIAGTYIANVDSYTAVVAPLAGPPEEEIQNHALSRAKSWIMAIVLTPTASFRPSQAHAKLHKLAASSEACERVMAQAVKSLQRDKFISRMSNAGKNANNILGDKRIPNIRSWEASVKFYDVFNHRRQITSKMLRTAAKYKVQILDRSFASGQSVTLVRDCLLDDGEMIPVLNLLSMGMVSIRPGFDKPDTRYGLDWERRGYTTKLIDKKVLGFSVVLESTSGMYISGDVYHDIRQNLPIPRGELDDPTGRGRIPLWFDITHTLLPELWEMIVGAVVGIISIRPGVDDHELSRNLNGVVNHWEMEMVTKYLRDLGAIKKTRSGGGWETRQWWWMTLGCAQTTT